MSKLTITATAAPITHAQLVALFPCRSSVTDRFANDKKITIRLTRSGYWSDCVVYFVRSEKREVSWRKGAMTIESRKFK